MSQYSKPLSYVRDYPGKGEAVILLHGFLASKSYWSKIIPTLRRDGSRVIAIDLLGFGDSPKPKNISYGYADHLQHITATLQTLGIDGRVTLVGHSMGALLSLRYAETFPEKVKAINLINPPMYANSTQAYHTLRSTSGAYRLLLDSKYRHILWGLLRKTRILASHSRHSREGSLENVIMPATFFNDLRNAIQPTLLVIGRHDRHIYLDNLHKTTLGDNVTLRIEESGHHSPITHSTSIGEYILNSA